MGEHDVPAQADERQHRAFMRALLDDVNALERLLEEGMIESGVRRIGAEQELFLVDRGCEPAPVGPEVLADIGDPTFTSELARFNLEANLKPYEFGGDCLSRMEADLEVLIAKARRAARVHGAEVLLTGILPTLQMSDLKLENMSPDARYAALNRELLRQRGGDFRIHIKGTDEFYATHDNVLVEACNTSFQIHFQVGAEEFAPLYNLSQVVTAPVLAAASNSPLFCERRLWQETRVALFQHSVDQRSPTHAVRGQRPRVQFGARWLEKSVLEIFRDDIARFRVVLPGEIEERPLEMVRRGEVPQLQALCRHNGTVWRWNRACYGVTGGKAHLRIENRVLPSGPTILDEMANAAFYYGLMSGLSERYDDIRQVIEFEDAKTNFVAAARLGLQAQFTWLGGKTSGAVSLILDELLPLARAGLEKHSIAPADCDRYLEVIRERVESRRTGSQWCLASLAAMGDQGTPHQRCRALTSAMLARQIEGTPVHTWTPAVSHEATDWRHSYKTVGQFMTKDLFTVRADDLVDLAANLMDWRHIRHVPVEDDEGRLVGLVSHRALIRLLARGDVSEPPGPAAVRAIMKVDPITVTPDTPTLAAIDLMRRYRVACLPVVSGDKLVGILTERDLITVAAKLFDERLREFDQE